MAGLEAWSNDNIQIQGISGTVTVNVTPSRAQSKLDADIKLNITEKGRGLTLGSVIWKPGLVKGFSIPLGWSIYRQEQANGGDAVSNVVAHKFGHVLGLMDAYGTVYSPEAPSDKAPQYDIMRSPYRNHPVFSDTDYEMMLYAWKLDVMQGYTDGWFAQVSQAFFH